MYKRQELAEYAAYCIGRGIPVAVGDCATVNSGDEELVDLLRQKGLLFRLAGYAGWNTSDNTLGTAVSMGMLYRYFGDRPAHRNFLALRYIEDVGYDAVVRDKVIDGFAPPVGEIGGHIPPRGEAADFARKGLEAYADSLVDGEDGRIVVEDCWFPWERAFEIGLAVRFEERQVSAERA